MDSVAPLNRSILAALHDARRTLWLGRCRSPRVENLQARRIVLTPKRHLNRRLRFVPKSIKLHHFPSVSVDHLAVRPHRLAIGALYWHIDLNGLPPPKCYGDLLPRFGAGRFNRTRQINTPDLGRLPVFVAKRYERGPFLPCPVLVSKRPVTVFGPAVELGEALEIIPEISPELASELSHYGTDGDNLGR